MRILRQSDKDRAPQRAAFTASEDVRLYRALIERVMLLQGVTLDARSMWSLADSRNVVQLRAWLLWMLQQHDATVILPNWQEVCSGGRCWSLWYPA